MARVKVTRDDMDQRPGADPLRMEGIKPGMVGRWVRFKGYDAEGHVERMREKGYVNVERTRATEGSGDDPRLSVGQHAQLDGTIKRGDVMLMQIPQELYERSRRESRERTEHRTRATLDQFKREGGRES
jgi:hypothetical protein